MFLYMIGNGALGYVTYHLWRNAKKYAEEPDYLRPFIDYSKYFMLLPTVILLMMLAGKGLCGGQSVDYGIGILVITHFVGEIVGLRYYLKWFEREIVRMEQDEYMNGCKRTWDGGKGRSAKGEEGR